MSPSLPPSSQHLRSDTHHVTPSASFSRMLWAVRQLNRTNWGKPNTGSTFFLNHAFVLGSREGVGWAKVAAPEPGHESQLLRLQLRPRRLSSGLLLSVESTWHHLRHLPASRTFARAVLGLSTWPTAAQVQFKKTASETSPLTHRSTVIKPAFVDHQGNARLPPPRNHELSGDREILVLLTAISQGLTLHSMCQVLSKH